MRAPAVTDLALFKLYTHIYMYMSGLQVRAIFALDNSPGSKHTVLGKTGKPQNTCINI